MRKLLAKIILILPICLIVKAFCLADLVIILPPDDGGVVIVPEPGTEPPPEPDVPVITPEPEPGEEPIPPEEPAPPEDPIYPDGEPQDKPNSEYEIWVTMPESNIIDGKPPQRHKISYEYEVISFTVNNQPVFSAVVQMEKVKPRVHKGDPEPPQTYVSVSITEAINKLIEHGIYQVLLIVAYDDKVHDGNPVVYITYEPGSEPVMIEPVDFYIQASLQPETLNLNTPRDFILGKISVIGTYSPFDIKPETVRITEVQGTFIGNIYGSITDPKMTVNKNFLLMHFPLAEIQDKIPAGDNVSFRIDGTFKDDTPFVCAVFVRVIRESDEQEDEESSGANENNKENNQKKEKEKLQKHKKEKIDKSHGGTLKIDQEASIEILPDVINESEIEIEMNAEINNSSNEYNMTFEGSQDFINRQNAVRSQQLSMIGNGICFGPEGLSFKKPVVLTLYYETLGTCTGAQNLKIYYWNKIEQEWQEIPGSKSMPTEKKVMAEINHFSIYQIMAPPLSVLEDITPITPRSDFIKGEIYAYPNPIMQRKNATIHVEVGKADAILVRIYDIAGQCIHSTEITGDPQVVNGIYAYEYSWDVGNMPSGVYVCSVRAMKEGHEDITVIKKIAVIK